jgi:hypothetical protein
LSYVLFFVYLALFSWLLTKIRFIRNAGLGPKIVIGLFLLKVIAGVINGRLLLHANYLADTWIYNIQGIDEYHLLFSDPKEYFLNFVRSPYSSGYAGFFQSSQSYWNNLRSNIMIKLLSLFDIFSFGNYYVNVIIYNFIVFFGNVGLYKIFTDVYKNKKNLLVVSCFLLPSLLFFGSSIHKEGLILLAIVIIVYNIYYSLHYTGFTFMKIFYIVLSFCFIFFLRNFIFIALLPAVAALFIAEYKKVSPLWTFLIIYLVSGVIFFNSGRINSRLNLPEKVVQRQIDFLALPKSTTNIDINPLNPTFKSFIANLPRALDHSLLQPHWWNISLSTKYLFPFAAEFFLYEMILLLFIFFFIKKKKLVINEPFILFGLFFSLSVFLMIGYTIPIVGAIIRYRSIYLPFILSPLLCNINWDFLVRPKQIINNKIF